MLSKLLTLTAASTLMIAIAPAVQAQDVTRLTVALPVNLCLANWPFYVAASEGMFAEEGLDVAMEGLDGSSTAIQATLAGQSQIAVSAPADVLAASGAGANLIGFYSFYQYLPFDLVTLADSDIASLADLEGRTIGMSSPGGGEAIFMRSVMSNSEIEEGSYEELAVGEGSAAATALTSGVVDAFSASFVDEIIFSAMGLSYQKLKSETYPAVTGLVLTTPLDYFEANPNVIEGIGRGLARATAAGLADRDLVVSVCGAVAPQETEDMGFATSVLDAVDPIFTLLEPTNGQYGQTDEAGWAEYRDLIIEIGIARPAAAETEVSNQYVSVWNQ
tara:strand:- start:7593 stop:8588 length:996 start_codon:yes stop_codon:yes gene_type:complete